MKQMPSQTELMNREWDEIAKRNPHYGIFSWPDFQDPSCVDEEKFYSSGTVQADAFLAAIGIQNTHEQAMLEIGCGIGRMTHRFAELFEKVYALDISQVMLDRARHRLGARHNVWFVKGSGQDLAGVGEASVHFVFSFLVLQHLTDPELVLRYVRESARVLRPSGVAFLQFGTVTSGQAADAGISSGPRVAQWLSARLPARPADALRGLARRMGRLWPGSSACWWNEGLWHTTVQPRPELTDDITRTTVWRGCRVEVGRVLETCASSGLVVKSLQGAGTQYTFLAALKRG